MKIRMRAAAFGVLPKLKEAFAGGVRQSSSGSHRVGHYGSAAKDAELVIILQQLSDYKIPW